ncbi:DUF4403 family protein [Sphingomonas aracearum]|uniref:DUF4403 family protein n=1 Tax=Sphingomonas aracearum TaxID=2283317 RepID=A0A369VY48_9SPHN|nr:DUF4403 family protein [Sphingomonas aracearum]RDE06555.1 DUF4403 family protein [Sphingomonas aracearum]
MRLFASAILLTLAACSKQGGNPAPPRVDGPAVLPRQVSSIVVPVSAPLADVEAALEQSVPRTLWRIDRYEEKCVPAQRVDLGIAKVKVLPTLGCRITGQVRRGRIRLSGRGSQLAITLPVSATIAARDVGGVASKTATGAATVRAVARLGIAPNWSPTANVDLAYDWTQPPGIDFLGRRIEFVGPADRKLKGVLADLERALPAKLAGLNLRGRLAGVWRQAFTSIQLNGDRPPAWMRITPQRIGFGGYRVTGRTVEMTIAAEALTETFVGDRPSDPRPAPLPPPSRGAARPGLRFFIPVLADYRQLEPVVERTLGKLAARGITLSGIGPVEAEFGKVTVYATAGGRLAVGVKARVRAKGSSWATTKGEVWLSAVPFNAPGSQLVEARDIRFATQTDSTVVNLLSALFANDAVRANIAGALRHDFAPDYQKVVAAARRAIGQRREGDFLLSADITSVTNGRVQVTGQGLFLPVRAEGEARIRFHPR